MSQNSSAETSQQDTLELLQTSVEAAHRPRGRRIAPPPPPEEDAAQQRNAEDGQRSGQPPLVTKKVKKVWTKPATSGAPMT